MSDASDELSQMRENYTIGAFRRSDLRHCPIEQFSEWMKEVKSAEIIEPNACTLATSRIGGSPSTRSVLLKGIENGYFLFFTNFGSRKARDLKENPQAVMHFPWWSMQRQATVEGLVDRLDDESAKEYFHSRPLESRLGAWASRQSEVIESRESLENAFEEVTERFGENPPKPPFWGGFRLKPETLEFWQGRTGRLHDRFRYSRTTENEWKIERLSP
ncbi:MAG: pyridoxamine 5'-phosphate oxidase [Opitutae bacterium]|nr:pyridoxamine 5'-phosphate oxidase [Opitutae bacterium]